MTTDPPAFNLDEPRARVGVVIAQTAPGSPRMTSGHERTLAALERVFPVRFEPIDPTDLHPSGIDGVLMLGHERAAKVSADLPQLVLPRATPAPGSGAQTSGGDTAVGVGDTMVGDPAGAPGETSPVALATGPALARPLRGRVIPESADTGESPLPAAGATVLARVRDRPVWWQIGAAGATLGVSAFPLAALAEDEALREHLRGGRFMGLLPLVHFLGQILGDGGWRLPPLRASFVVDDPNLHWTSYGFLKYRQLAAHAARHGYHVGFATVPLDGWLVTRRAASLFAQNGSVLSLTMHGNDHVARELGRLDTEAAACPPIAQALRRVDAIERRHGVSIERVMVPPFEACSQAALQAMFRLGVEAACHTLPYPWRDPQTAATPLAGWHPAELVAGGMPILLRYPLDAPREDLALRALLGQPLILYGHHGDFAQGLDILAQAAAEIEGLGDVRWGSLGWIARGNYATRRVGETLLVRMHARRVAIEVPAGVRALRVLIGEPLGGAAGHRVLHAGAAVEAGATGEADAAVEAGAAMEADSAMEANGAVEAGTAVEIAYEGGLGASRPLTVDAPSQIELTLMADRPLSPAEVPSPGVNPWPLARRILVEGRDRIQALRR
jgi:hypothetical protein